MIRLLDDGLGGAQGVTNDKIRQVSVVQGHRTQEQRFLVGPNPLVWVLIAYMIDTAAWLSSYRASSLTKGKSARSAARTL